MQDVMLSGGSDAAIIPIGISFLLYPCKFYLSIHRLVIARRNLLFTCWCRLGRFCGMQSTFPEEQWSYKSITPLGHCMSSFLFCHCLHLRTFRNKNGQIMFQLPYCDTIDYKYCDQRGNHLDLWIVWIWFSSLS